MKRVVTVTAAAAIAALATGIVFAEGLGGIAPPPAPAEPVPPPPPPEPPAPPVAPAPPAPVAPGVVKSVNLSVIKAVFDNAGVPAEIQKTNDGFSYVAAKLGGNFVATAPLDCKNSDPNGECGAVVILSGTMSAKLTPAQINEYQQDLHLATPLLVGQGEPMLRYAFLINDGIAPNYLEGTLVAFKYEMDSFATFVSKAKSGPGSSFSAGGAAKETFSTVPNLSEAAGSLSKGGALTP